MFGTQSKITKTCQKEGKCDPKPGEKLVTGMTGESAGIRNWQTRTLKTAIINMLIC